MSGQARIDVHHHIVPPEYRQWLSDNGIGYAGGTPIPEWSVEAALELMDKADVETAVLSLSTPGVHIGSDADARRMARRVNDFAAEVVNRHPKRFGFFAVLTLPDLDGALTELEYALDELHADGIVLLANAKGTYLGDPVWDPLMQELNRRSAVVFEHPAGLAAPHVPNVPEFAADYLLDTARAALSLAINGCMERYPDLKIILAHGGGFVPYAAERFAIACSPDGTFESGVARLQRFYFDTALAGSHWALPSLTAFADPDKIMFGSDWPYANTDQALHFVDRTDSFDMPGELRRGIARKNAEKLFPRLGS